MTTPSQGLGHDRRGDRFANVYTGPGGAQYLGYAWHTRAAAVNQHSTEGGASGYRRIAMLHIRPKGTADAQQPV